MNTAITAKPEVMKRIITDIEKAQGNNLTFIVTDAFKQKAASGIITDFVKEGNESLLLITGPELGSQPCFMEHGWDPINDWTQHIDSFMEVTAQNIGEKVKELIVSGK